MNKTVSNSSDRNLTRYPFSLRSLLIATAIIAIFTSYIVNNGIFVALIFGVLSLLVCLSIYRIKSWHNRTIAGRVYIVLSSGLFFRALSSIKRKSWS
jgi:hypothetical protein